MNCTQDQIYGRIIKLYDDEGNMILHEVAEHSNAISTTVRQSLTETEIEFFTNLLTRYLYWISRVNITVSYGVAHVNLRQKSMNDIFENENDMKTGVSILQDFRKIVTNPEKFEKMKLFLELREMPPEFLEAITSMFD